MSCTKAVRTCEVVGEAGDEGLEGALQNWKIVLTTGLLEVLAAG
jgi:hypothetical protein